MKLDPERQKKLNRAMSELEMEIMLGMIAQDVEDRIGWSSRFIHPVTSRPWQIRIEVSPDRW